MDPAIEIMRERAAAAVQELSARVPAGSIRAAFAGGSVARGEVWSASRNGVLEVFSDIDLYVVISEDADAALVRRAAAETASAMPSAGADAVFRRGIDVGVYRQDDLLAQPVRPGTVDLAQHHLWLAGDRSLVALMATALARPMDRSEALYLLENRAWDALEAPHDALEGAGAVTAAKVTLDVLAAHLIAEGRFAPTYTARRAENERQPVLLLSDAARVAIAQAEQFRTGTATTTIAPDAALELVVDAWLALGATILFGEGGPANPIEILSARCQRGQAFHNYRQLVRSRRRLGLSLPGAALAGLRFAALSPPTVLRTHAIVRGLIASKRVSAESVAFHSSYAARLSSRVAFGGATFDRRARAAMKAMA